MNTPAGPRVRAKCCGSVIQSRSIHDVCYCSCGKVGIAGGDTARLEFPEGPATDWIEVIDPEWNLQPEEKKPVEKPFLW